MLGFNKFNQEQAKEDRDEQIQAFMGMDAGYIGKNHPKIHKVGMAEDSSMNEEFDAEAEAKKSNLSAFDPEKDKRFSQKYLHGNIRTKADVETATKAGKKGKAEGERTQEGRLIKHAKLENTYGKQGKAVSNSEISDNAVDTIKSFHKLDAKGKREALSSARKKRKLSSVGGSHLSGNTKNETANDVEIAGRKNHTYGISGSPARYPHIHGDGSIKDQVTCPHATESCGGGDGEKGIGGSCLAQKAQGQQDATRVNRDHYSQSERHSKQSNSDHVITMANEIRNAHKKATAQGRNLLLRGDNYTNDHDAKYNEMHKELNAQLKKETGHGYKRYGYTKNPEDKNDPENDNFKVWSNSGPFVKKNPETGKHEFIKPLENRDKHMTNQTTEHDDNKHPMNQYVVANLPRPNSASKTKKDKKYKAHEEFMNNIKTFRSWKKGEDVPEGHKETHVEPEHQSKDEYHHPDGHGWTTKTRQENDENGNVVTKKRRYHYQDYTAITPAHDNRASDEEQNAGKTKNKHGKKVGLAIVSSAVSSTPKQDLSHSTMFHDASHLDKETGILHANHPDNQEHAFAHQKATGRPTSMGIEVPSKKNVSKLGLKESVMKFI